MTLPTAWDDECDLLVIGSGGGALVGAYTAAREGLSVIVCEATDFFGGTTAYSGGGMWFPTNAVLRRAGDTDTLEQARTYYHAVVGDRTPRELQDAFLDTGARLIDYLENDPAFEFVVHPWPDYYGSAPEASATGRHIAPKSLSSEQLGDLRARMRPTLAAERCGEPLPDELAGGQALVGRLLLALRDQPRVNLRTAAVAQSLCREGDAVLGARVSEGGKERAIRAGKGVLIAAGGFEANQGLRDRFEVPGRAQDTMGPDGNQGLALLAAIEIGADVDLMSQAWWAPGITHPDGRSTFSLWLTGGIFVDQQGRRFVNESGPYDRIGRTTLDRIAEGSMTLPFWMIYDDREGVRPPVRATSVPVGDPADYQRAGLWHTADTLSELAEHIGVPPAQLIDTVERFNGFAANDRDDDFARGSEAYDRAFAEDGSPLVPIEKGPFHAAAFGLSDLGTKGGLRTDASARVLDLDGAVIAGLYAAGNSMAAPSGTTYPAGGNPIGTSMVFAHLAALDAAAVSASRS